MAAESVEYTTSAVLFVASAELPGAHSRASPGSRSAASCDDEIKNEVR